MFKRIVNNQALLNGLKQIKRSDNNDQNQIIVAGNQSSTLLVPYGTSNNKFGTELEEFCTGIVSQDSAIFKIAKQICAEQGTRIKEIALEVLKDSGLGNNISNNNNSNSSTCSSSNSNAPKKLESTSNSSIVKSTTSSHSEVNPLNNSQSSSVTFEQVETKPVVKKHGKFYGTNKMFLLDEDEIVNISTIPTTNISPITIMDEDVRSVQSSQSLNLDIVKRLLMDIFGKLKNLVMILLNSLFGNRQNIQSDQATTQVAAQSLVLVISFMIYNIVAGSSPAELHQDILVVFQEYLSNNLNN